MALRRVCISSSRVFSSASRPRSIALREMCIPSSRLFSSSSRILLPSQSNKLYSPSGSTLDPEKAAVGSFKRLPEFSLVDKVVIVTGGARGLGLTQAEALLEAGATVYALDRLPEPSDKFGVVAERAEKELGTSLHYRQIDVRDVPALNKTIEEIADKHGRLDGLIAAAGIQQETPALEYTAEDANRMFEVNITGVFMSAQAVARQMIKLGKPGSIVLIASMSGTVANRGLICPAYNASKAGVVQLTRNLASEWGEYGIRVNSISPGYIVTAMVEELFKTYPERREVWATHNMLGRLSTPEEYRGAAVFLISDASSFMSASDIIIDGGHTKWLSEGMRALSNNVEVAHSHRPCRTISYERPESLLEAKERCAVALRYMAHDHCRY